MIRVKANRNLQRRRTRLRRGRCKRRWTPCPMPRMARACLRGHYRLFERVRRSAKLPVIFQRGKLKVRSRFTIKCSMSARVRRFLIVLGITPAERCDDETRTASNFSKCSDAARQAPRVLRILNRIYSVRRLQHYLARLVRRPSKARVRRRFEQTLRASATFVTFHSRATPFDRRHHAPT